MKGVVRIKKIDETVLKETVFVSIWIGIFSLIMQGVFIAIGKWDYTVLLGNLLSGFAGIFNFLLLGVTVQRAVATGDTKKAKRLMRTSQFLRLLMMAAVAILGASAPVFNLWACLIPFLFPRLSMFIRQLTLKNEKGVEDEK